ncbi:MAG: tRNA pseudouridine(55) synthase TruB [Selenomonadaceae bacterium]
MPDGFINVLKPPGMTSHDVVSFIRRTYGLKKVGHAGTLDPAAAGILPVALGRATRLIEYMTDADKAYRAEMTFGFATDSGDDTGTVIETSTDFTLPETSELKQILAEFRGINRQIPPIYSAIKINGKRACDLARKNIEVTIPERQIEIYDISLLSSTSQTMLFDVNCSKGTYIRTLCIDIGRRLGIPAHMSFLVRSRVGSFALPDAFTLEEIKLSPEKALCSMDKVLAHLPQQTLSVTQGADFMQGKKIAVATASKPAGAIRIYQQTEFIGIGEYDFDHRCLIPVKVIVPQS